MKFENKTFDNAGVQLDGNEYVGCTFQSCTFFFAGRESFTFWSNKVSADCGFKFTDCAANTVATMKAIYGMGPWGRAHILATFEQIAPDLKQMH